MTAVAIALMMLVAAGFAPAANAQAKANSSAYGAFVDLHLLGLGANSIPVVVGPLPTASGSAPPAYNSSNSVANINVFTPQTGQLLNTGVVTVTAASQVPASDNSSASAAVDTLDLNVTGIDKLLTLHADAVRSQASVTGPCGSPLTTTGSTTLVLARLGGSLIGPTPIVIDNNPGPNTVLLDLPGVKIILNEQIVTGNGTTNSGITVNAIHIILNAFQPLGLLDVINGDIIIAQSQAALQCPVADVAITKVDTPDPVTQGQPLTYTLTATNNGPDTANAVTIVDALPSSAQFVSATPSQGTCSGVTTVTCAMGTLAPGATATVTIVIRPQASGQITNTATVSSSAIDPNQANNTATAQTTVTPLPQGDVDVSVTKSDSPDPVAVGSNVTYTLNVANSGPATAVNVTATDTLPASVTIVSVNTTAGVCTPGGTVNCVLGDMAPNATATITIVARTNAAGVITNTATVTSLSNDTNPGNNTSTVTTTVNPSANMTSDVSITKADNPDPVPVGSNVTYTINVTNNGPDPATGVTVIDTLPGTATFISTSTTQGACTGGVTVNCTLGTMQVGGIVTITVVVQPQAEGVITNSVNVTTTSSDTNPGNNIATVTTTVVPANSNADVAITKTDSPDPVQAGDNVGYAIAVTNNGPITASGVTVTDSLPPEVTFGSAVPSQGTCNVNGSTLTCNLGTINAGSSATINVLVQTHGAGQITNTAQVTSQTPDPNPNNNSASATTTVTSGPPPNNNVDLSMDKVGSPNPVSVGSDLTYTLTIRNKSTSPATNVFVTDTLPSTTMLISAIPSQGTCRRGQTVTCDLGTIAGGQIALVTIIVRPMTPGGIINSATVTGNEPDPNPSDNTDDFSSNVIGQQDQVADLTLTKTDCPRPASTSDVITYTITIVNRGPNIARDVKVTDNMPAGLTIVAISPSQGTCTGTTTINCMLGDMQPNSRATVAILARAANPGTFVNSASVSSAAGDPTTTNNNASLTTLVGTPGAATTEMFFPIIGDSLGALGTNWRSDLRLLNTSGSDALVTIEWFPAGDSPRQGPNRTVTLPVRSLRTAVFNNVVRDFVNESGLGAMRLTSTTPLAGSVRIYNDQRRNPAVNGTYGEFVRAYRNSDALPTGSLLLLSNGTFADGHGFRTNLGYYNASPNPAAITFRVYAGDGTLLGAKTIGVQGWANRSSAVFSLIDTVPADKRNLEDFYIQYDTNGSRMFVFATVIDNQTNDSMYVLATPE